MLWKSPASQYQWLLVKGVNGSFSIVNEECREEVKEKCNRQRRKR